MSVEKKAFNVLEQQPYEVVLGGKTFLFNHATLKDRQEISSIIANVPDINFDTEKITDIERLQESLKLGKYAKEIAEIITIAAHLKGDKIEKRKLFGFILIKKTITEQKQRNELFQYAYEKASLVEVYNAIRSIAAYILPAFFLDIIISLKGQNILIPTKETEATAHGR